MKQTYSLQHFAALSRKSILYIGFASALSLPSIAQAAKPDNVFSQIIQNMVRQETEETDITHNDRQTSTYLQLLDSQGAFTDIDYNSHAQTLWKPMDHIKRMKEMAVSYITPQSRYYGNKRLHKVLVKMLSHWYAANPRSTNWWCQEIGWPQPMGLTLALLRTGKHPVPEELEAKILERMKQISKGPDQKGSQGTGANKMDIALQWIYRTCLQADEKNLQFAVQQFYYPIRFNTGQGIQSDYSYLQHGQQLYTGGYGASVLNAYLKVAFYLMGTPYADKEKNELICQFVRYGYLPAIRGSEMLYNSMGRGLSRPNATHQRHLAKLVERLIKLDAAHEETYKSSIRRLKEEVPPCYGIIPFHRHYWRGDYTLHQRPGYTMDVRMASTRTFRCENGNGENLKGYFLTEGGTGIVRRGDEYRHIFPVWDWSHLPGTTVPNLPEVPVPAPWAQRGQSTFAGGVSDGKYGVTTYQMRDEHFGLCTSAKKSWFFFDREIVCMGSDIQSSNSYPIHTTVNQCLLKGDVTLLFEGKAKESIQAEGEQAYTNLVCVHHDSISYFFPNRCNVTLRNDIQKGSWKQISSPQAATPLEEEIFKLWIDHGTKPQKGSYLYYIVPNTPSAQATESQIDALECLNTDTLQAVYNHTLHQLGIVFHQAGKIHLGNVTVKSEHPCAVLLTGLESKRPKVYLTDPSYQLQENTLEITLPHSKETKRLTCSFPADPLYVGSTLEINIPQ